MAIRSTGLSTHIWNNNFRCIVLLSLYPILLAVIFGAIALVFSMGAVPHHYGQSPNFQAMTSFALNITFEFFPLILTGVIIWFLIAWFFHTSMIRKLSHSRPVSRQEEPELYNLLENLCISRGIPMPKFEIIETDALNAFASGISDASYSITVTRGLMNSLPPDELEGVLAHELTHIINRDVRLLIVTIIFTGLFGFLAQMAWSNIRYGLLFGSGRRDRNNNGASGLILIALITVILWLGYMATLLMRFALSRRREYMADAGAVTLTKNPEAMMRALMRISGRDKIPGATADIAMMCIENHVPFMGIFATHPPIKARIQAISDTTNTPVPDLSFSASGYTEEAIYTPNPSNRRKFNPWLGRPRT